MFRFRFDIWSSAFGVKGIGRMMGTLHVSVLWAIDWILRVSRTCCLDLRPEEASKHDMSQAVLPTQNTAPVYERHQHLMRAFFACEQHIASRTRILAILMLKSNIQLVRSRDPHFLRFPVGQKIADKRLGKPIYCTQLPRLQPRCPSPLG